MQQRFDDRRDHLSSAHEADSIHVFDSSPFSLGMASMQFEPDNKSCKDLLSLLKSRQAKFAKPRRAKLQDNPLIRERRTA